MKKIGSLKVSIFESTDISDPLRTSVFVAIGYVCDGRLCEIRTECLIENRNDPLRSAACAVHNAIFQLLSNPESFSGIEMKVEAADTLAAA